jgi:glutamate--cysteine ligase
LTIAPPKDPTIISSIDELLEPFRAGERPPEQWSVGLEVEKFGVLADTFEPLAYAGKRGVLRVLELLADRYGWHEKREEPTGPVIGLERGEASVSLEPGAQIELGTEPCPDLHALARSFDAHLAELVSVGKSLACEWLEVGFHPLATQAELDWVPKRRYPIMREYLPRRGSGALDMMRRTATVQASFDYESEADALRKLGVALRIAPLLNAITANSPLVEGRLAGYKSARGLTWLQMDPSRTGLIPTIWAKDEPSYSDYADWALGAGMFFFVREGRLVPNTGQTFRSFLRDGYAGNRATVSDWAQHLNTVFPEVRLRRTLEVRSSDALPSSLTVGVPALLTGVLYDSVALDQARELLGRFDHALVERARPELVRRGVETRLGDVSTRALAEALLDIAAGGLRRRARIDAEGRDETRYLAGLARLVEHGRSPADDLTHDLPADPGERAREIVRRTRLTSRCPPRPETPCQCPEARSARYPRE